MSADLVARLEKLTGPDRDADWRIEKLLVRPEEFPDIEIWPTFQQDSKFERSIPAYTASLDAVVALVERKLPDTDERRHSCTIWTGRRPAARIFYQQRCAEDEGGWAIGALNNWEVRGSTPAIALLLALFNALRVLEAEGACDVR